MDTFDQPYWNPMQLLGWVYRRDRQWVRKAADSVIDHGSYRYEVRLPDGRMGFGDFPLSSPGPTHLAVTDALKGSAAYDSIAEAEDAILAALQEGHLTARGLENGQGDVKEIPPIQWLGLTLHYNPPHAAEPPQHPRSGATSWYRLKFKRGEIMELWPDRQESAPETPKVEPANHASSNDDAQYVGRNSRLQSLAKKLRKEHRGWTKADIAMQIAEDHDFPKLKGEGALSADAIEREIRVTRRKKGFNRRTP